MACELSRRFFDGRLDDIGESIDDDVQK